MTNDIAERIARRINAAMLKHDDGNTRTLPIKSLTPIVRTELEGEAVGFDADGLEIAINTCKDVTTLKRFARSVDPVRWVEGLQAHLESLRISSPVAQDGEIAAIRERQSDGYDEASGGDPYKAVLLMLKDVRYLLTVHGEIERGGE